MIKRWMLVAFLAASGLFSQTITSIDYIVDNMDSLKNQTFTIEGVILNDFGVIQDSRTNVFIVSPTGHALNVNKSTKYETLARGQRVRITGTVSVYQEAYQISPDAAPTVLESDVEIPAPIKATVAEIQALKYHGDYVQVSGKVTDLYATGTSGINLEIGDQKRPFDADRAVVRIWSTTGITLEDLESKGIEVGKIVTVRGATGAFNNAGQLISTELSDFEVGILSDVDYPSRNSFVEVPAQVFDVKSSNGVDFTVKAPAGAEVRMAIYSFNGRKIRSFDYFLSSGSSQIITWDFLSDDYRKVKLGTYILFLEAVEDNGRKSVHKAPIVVGTRL